MAPSPPETMTRPYDAKTFPNLQREYLNPPTNEDSLTSVDRPLDAFEKLRQ